MSLRISTDRFGDSSEKAPKMFGTLVICLPSLHEGGEVELSFGDSTKNFETSQYSEFGMSFMAWHEYTSWPIGVGLTFSLQVLRRFS